MVSGCDHLSICTTFWRSGLLSIFLLHTLDVHEATVGVKFRSCAPQRYAAIQTSKHFWLTLKLFLNAEALIKANLAQLILCEIHRALDLDELVF